MKNLSEFTATHSRAAYGRWISVTMQSLDRGTRQKSRTLRVRAAGRWRGALLRFSGSCWRNAWYAWFYARRFATSDRAEMESLFRYGVCMRLAAIAGVVYMSADRVAVDHVLRVRIAAQAREHETKIALGAALSLAPYAGWPFGWHWR
jgi:hypothetical protein